ncbi:MULTISPECIES: hypothetical protein [Paraburkholderia]|uniref:Lipoprotein n=1 Tax=Paraburkholderia podalyriae TaxID=1938811 RepID=A0ABR7PNN4_9BURK|nr:hypothetical protein [Paraburkholderia podalyriae]MBC8747875.1 hypothetical protein [Paraburkholderia podalyriae]
MNIRILSIACIASAATLLAACTIVTRNSSACEQLMRSKLAEASSGVSSGMSSDTLRVTHRGAAIRGSRVVVEGSIEHPVSASEVAASAALVPSASDVKVAAKPAQPKKLSTPAAAECTFHGEELDVFRWLAPAKLATPAAQPASAAG